MCHEHDKLTFNVKLLGAWGDDLKSAQQARRGPLWHAEYGSSRSLHRISFAEGVMVRKMGSGRREGLEVEITVVDTSVKRRVRVHPIAGLSVSLLSQDGLLFRESGDVFSL